MAISLWDQPRKEFLSHFTALNSPRHSSCTAVLTVISETNTYIPAVSFYFNLLPVSHKDSPVVLNTMNTP